MSLPLRSVPEFRLPFTPSPFRALAACFLVFGFVPSFFSFLLLAKERWIEFNIGPFYVDTPGDPGPARETLAQLEQLRWVLGNLLEAKDLPSLWPIRILLLNSKNEGTNPTAEFVSQNAQFLLGHSSGAKPPLAAVAGLLLDANTPRLPADVESGLRALFSTLEAHGSRVTWGGPPARPDLAWARMQLFATKFEYGASFHIFLTALKGGSTLAAAERNAFGKSSDALEAEAQANLDAGHWVPVPVSGRPLDPKRDFGAHTLDPVLADIYLADWTLSVDPKQAEAAYRTAVESGGDAAALGYEGLAQVAKRDGQDARAFCEDAIRAGSRSAPVYVAAADGLPETEALPLLKRAVVLNPRWAEPVYRQVGFAESPADKEMLLKRATTLAPRNTSYWIELARLQTTSGEGTSAQGSWLRAEDSAPTEAERERVHKLRIDSEGERLEAAEQQRRRERDAVHLADQQAQQAESDRISAAEQKANQSVTGSAGAGDAAGAVPWDSLVKQTKLAGTLTRVDCLRHGFRLSITARSGSVTRLFLPDAAGASLACGAQAPPPHVSLEYRATPNDDLHTVGDVTTFQLR